MNRIGKVFVAGRFAGWIEQVGGGSKFTYAAEWLARRDAVPISLTMPLREEPYVHPGLHPFFENLLPEGWLLDITAKKFKLSKSDSLGLLLATCGDCVGAVEVTPVGSDGEGFGLGDGGYGDAYLDGSGYGSLGYGDIQDGSSSSRAESADMKDESQGPNMGSA